MKGKNLSDAGYDRRRFRYSRTRSCPLRNSIHGQVHFFPVNPFHQSHAMQQAEAGAPEGVVYLADEQTAGRGRGGARVVFACGLRALRQRSCCGHGWPPRTFYGFRSPPGLLSRRRACRSLHLRRDIRWPNDLLFGEAEKFCGILTRAQRRSEPRIRHSSSASASMCTRSNFRRN